MSECYVVEQERDVLTATDKPAGRPPLLHEEGLVIGLLAALENSATPLVTFEGNVNGEAVRARSIPMLRPENIGCQVALMFEGGNPQLPIVVGCIQQVSQAKQLDLVPPTLLHPEALVDDKKVVFTAKEEIKLQCGKASITLTKAGKIIIRGEYVLSRSLGVNRIQGGSVQIN